MLQAGQELDTQHPHPRAREEHLTPAVQQRQTPGQQCHSEPREELLHLSIRKREFRILIFAALGPPSTQSRAAEQRAHV